MAKATRTTKSTPRIAKGRIVVADPASLPPDPLPISDKIFGARRRIPTQKRSLKTRRAILEAALKVADEQGVENLTMQSIATKAKIAAGTAYQFYDDRDAICFDIYLEWAEVWWATLMEATSKRVTTENWEQQVRGLVSLMGRFYFEHYDAHSLLRYVEATKAGGEAVRTIVEANIQRWTDWFGPLLKSVGYSNAEVQRICVAAVRTIRGHWSYGFASEAQWKELIRSAADGTVAMLKQKLAEAPRPARAAKSSGTSALR